MNRELRAMAKQLDPILRIGKNGFTDGVMNELFLQLKKRKLIKIKLLKSFADNVDKKEIASKIAEKTNSKVISVIGSSIVFWRR